MEMIGIWFFMGCKRYLRKLSFLLILGALPVAAFFLHKMETRDQQQIAVAVLLKGNQEGELGARLVERLVNPTLETDSEMFVFYQCEDEAQLEAEVASRRAECGYIILDGLEEKLQNRQYERSIAVYSAPSTVAAKLSTEVVFAAMIELYNQTLLQDYVAESPVFSAIGDLGSKEREGAVLEAGALYETWLASGETFRFAAEIQGQQKEQDSDVISVFPIRGLVAVFLYIVGLYSGVVNRIDWERGLFGPILYRYRQGCSLVALAGPVALAAVAGILALWSGGVLGNPGSEVLRMVLYVIGISLFSWVLSSLVRNPQVLCGLIPFFVIGSLLFCPVFVDIGRIIPSVRMVGRLFLPYYYLIGN